MFDVLHFNLNIIFTFCNQMQQLIIFRWSQDISCIAVCCIQVLMVAVSDDYSAVFLAVLLQFELN